MQAEAVRSHQHFAGSQSWTDIALEDFFMILVGNENHDYVGLLGGFCRGHDTHAISPGLRAALASFRQSNHDIAAGILHIEGMRMPLAAIADHGYTFLLDEFKVCVCIVI